MALPIKDGRLIVKNGALAESCDCCSYTCFTPVTGGLVNPMSVSVVKRCNSKAIWFDVCLTGIPEGCGVPQQWYSIEYSTDQSYWRPVDFFDVATSRRSGGPAQSITVVGRQCFSVWAPFIITDNCLPSSPPVAPLWIRVTAVSGAQSSSGVIRGPFTPELTSPTITAASEIQPSSFSGFVSTTVSTSSANACGVYELRYRWWNSGSEPPTYDCFTRYRWDLAYDPTSPYPDGSCCDRLTFTSGLASRAMLAKTTPVNGYPSFNEQHLWVVAVVGIEDVGDKVSVPFYVGARQ